MIFGVMLLILTFESGHIFGGFVGVPRAIRRRVEGIIPLVPSPCVSPPTPFLLMLAWLLKLLI